MERVPLYVINRFLKFERKIYQIFGKRLGRPIRLKSVLFYLFFGLLELLLYFTPIIGAPVRATPVGILVVFPGVLSYLLSDIGTEGRVPLAYFRSFLLYHWRRLRRVTYFRGRELPKPGSYGFRGYFTYRESSR
ncbi:TcpE family conjugal transfer membrane protein [Planifilum fimeticola]|uniref:TcpE family conjugal transfer membrane protein n=1 Tax=Planifilum fimeticola TaxID=201975 RepID=UPI001474C8E1|nr:TcpE family conjugal transfer membrane protein [Planifilum fimeticola]